MEINAKLSTARSFSMRSFFIVLIFGSIFAHAETELTCKDKYLELAKMAGIKNPKIYYRSLTTDTIYNSYEGYFNSESYTLSERKRWNRRIAGENSEKFKKLRDERRKIDNEIELERDPTSAKLRQEANSLIEKRDNELGRNFSGRVSVLELGCKDKIESACNDLKIMAKEVKKYDESESRLAEISDELRKAKTTRRITLTPKMTALMKRYDEIQAELGVKSYYGRRTRSPESSGRIGYGYRDDLPNHVNDQLEAFIYSENEEDAIKAYEQGKSGQLSKKTYILKNKENEARIASLAYPDDKVLKSIHTNYKDELKKLTDVNNRLVTDPPHFLVVHLRDDDGVVLDRGYTDHGQVGVTANCQYYNPSYGQQNKTIAYSCHDSKNGLCKIASDVDTKIAGQKFLGYFKDRGNEILEIVGKRKDGPAEVKQAK